MQYKNKQVSFWGHANLSYVPDAGAGGCTRTGSALTMAKPEWGSGTTCQSGADRADWHTLPSGGEGLRGSHRLCTTISAIFGTLYIAMTILKKGVPGT
jgi:hypothetical protein